MAHSFCSAGYNSVSRCMLVLFIGELTTMLVIWYKQKQLGFDVLGISSFTFQTFALHNLQFPKHRHTSGSTEQSYFSQEGWRNFVPLSLQTIRIKTRPVLTQFVRPPPGRCLFQFSPLQTKKGATHALSEVILLSSWRKVYNMCCRTLLFKKAGAWHALTRVVILPLLTKRKGAQLTLW